MDYTGKLTAVKANNIQLVLEEDFNLTEARRRTDKGENIRLKVTVIDKRSITPKQQKFIHALFGDVSDVDHVDAVGMGNNRNKIDHANRFYYCLCRTHHTERHTIGEIAFENKYHIKPILLNEEAVKELRIGK